MAVDPLTLESFLEYGIGMTFLFLRFFTRIRMFGIRHFEMEDLFTALAIVSIFNALRTCHRRVYLYAYDRYSTRR